MCISLNLFLVWFLNITKKIVKLEHQQLQGFFTQQQAACMCVASYCVVDPAVGDLRSSSVSENAVLHALHARIFSQVPERWLVLFHL